MNTQTLNQRRADIIPRGVSFGHDFYVAHAENATLWDEDGLEYIDFYGGIAVLNTGHRHPRITAAITEQLGKFTHSAFQMVPYGIYLELAERVAALAPINGAKKVAFFSTGAEAIENAVKIARASTGRTGIIAFSGAFHGRTALASTLTGKVDPYKVGFGPMSADVFHIPFPNSPQNVSVGDTLKGLEMLFKVSIDPQRVAAIILEPVQGEGGFYVAPPELMRALRKVCDDHGILLIVDEVQTGFARTGRIFAMEHYDVQADLIAVAKSLAGGMPLSGVIGKASVMDGPKPGGLGGTYAGNPLAIASALAVLDVIQDEKLCERAVALGEKLMARLVILQREVPNIHQVRGLGSMIAVEFASIENGKPDAQIVARIRARALEAGLVLISCGVYGNVIRFLYPLTIPDEQFDRALEIVDESIRVSARPGA